MLCVVSTIPTPSLCWNTKLLKQFFCFCWINCWSFPLALVLRDSFQDSFYKGGGWFSWTATTHPAFPFIPKVLVVDEVGQLVWPYDCNELGQPKLILAGSAHRSGSWGHDMLNGYADENPDESHSPAFRGQGLTLRSWHAEWLCRWKSSWKLLSSFQGSGLRPEVDNNF